MLLRNSLYVKRERKSCFPFSRLSSPWIVCCSKWLCDYWWPSCTCRQSWALSDHNLNIADRDTDVTPAIVDRTTDKSDLWPLLQNASLISMASRSEMDDEVDRLLKRGNDNIFVAFCRGNPTTPAGELKCLCTCMRVCVLSCALVLTRLQLLLLCYLTLPLSPIACIQDTAALIFAGVFTQFTEHWPAQQQSNGNTAIVFIQFIYKSIATAALHLLLLSVRNSWHKAEHHLCILSFSTFVCCCCCCCVVAVVVVTEFSKEYITIFEIVSRV